MHLNFAIIEILSSSKFLHVKLIMLKEIILKDESKKLNN
jgi:hypothetical protein